MIFDGLKNIVANLGTSRDKASSSGYFIDFMDDAQLQQIYRASWAISKAINIPARDSIKSWRSWEGDPDQVNAIEKEEERLNLIRVIELAQIFSGIFGGSAIFISDGQDPQDPFIPGRSEIRQLAVLTPRELSTSGLITNPDDPRFKQPDQYELAVSGLSQRPVHPSRLAIFKGSLIPDEELAATYRRGWGDSKIQKILDVSLKADSVQSNINSMTYESKLDVIGIPELSAKLQDKGYEKSLISRFQSAATLKGINGVLLLDKEEEHATKQLTFAGLADIMDRHYQIVAAAVDIPMTRFMGQSPAGQNSTGKSDLSNYYDNVAAVQRLDISPAIRMIDRAILMKALGSNPDDIWYNWNPLGQPTQKEVSETVANYAKAAADMVNAEVMRPDQLSEPVAQQMAQLGAFPGIEKAEDIGESNFDEEGE